MPPDGATARSAVPCAGHALRKQASRPDRLGSPTTRPAHKGGRTACTQRRSTALTVPVVYPSPLRRVHDIPPCTLMHSTYRTARRRVRTRPFHPQVYETARRSSSLIPHWPIKTTAPASVRPVSRSPLCWTLSAMRTADSKRYRPECLACAALIEWHSPCKTEPQLRR